MGFTVEIVPHRRAEELGLFWDGVVLLHLTLAGSFRALTVV
jgi:hypothetical protein